METHKQKSSEVIIPVLEHGQLHFGSGRVSELNIMITIAISPRASLGPSNPVCFGNAPKKSSEVFISVLQHVKLHLGSVRVCVLKIMIKITISHGPH